MRGNFNTKKLHFNILKIVSTSAIILFGFFMGITIPGIFAEQTNSMSLSSASILGELDLPDIMHHYESAVLADSELVTLRLENYATDGTYNPDYIVAQENGEELFFLQRGGNMWSAGSLNFYDGKFRNDVDVEGSIVIENDLLTQGASTFSGDSTFNKTIRSTSLIPQFDSVYSIGTSDIRYGTAYVDDIVTSASITTSDIDVTGVLAVNGSSGIDGQLLVSQGSESPEWQDISTALDANVIMKNGNSFGETTVIGTNDNNDFQFETNNTVALTINTNGDVDISSGVLMMAGNQIFKVDGTSMILSSNTTNTGTDNTFLGFEAGLLNTTGQGNTFVGKKAGYLNTTGEHNTFIGSTAGYSNTTGYRNTFVGRFAGWQNTTGFQNLFMGRSTAYENTTGRDNVALGGYKALNENVDGNYNIAIGTQSLFSNVSGDKNVGLGHNAGHSSLGDSNIFIGYQAGYSETGSNKLYIENSNSTTPLIWGDFNNDIIAINGDAGIGTTAPFSKLDVAGNESIGVDLINTSTTDYLYLGSRNDDYGNLTISYTGAAAAGQSASSINLRPRKTADDADYLASGITFREGGVTGSGNRGSIEFYTNSGSGPNQRMVLNEYGNLGIGTTAPVVPLEVHQTNDSYSMVRAESTVDNTSSYSTFEALSPDGGSGQIHLGVLTHAPSRTISRYGLTLGSWAEISTGIGSNYAEGLVIGTQDATPIVFGTNNSEAVRIDSNGRIGIGVTDPGSYDLMVAGDIYSNETDSEPNYIHVNAPQDEHSGFRILGGGNEKWYIYRPENTNDLEFYDIASRVTFEEGGQVGIGITNPLRNLHSYTSGESSYFMSDGEDTEDVGYIFAKDGVDTWYFYQPRNSNDLRLWDTADRVTFEAGGNVGIGTTNPLTRLHISQTATGDVVTISDPDASGELVIRNDSTGEPKLQLTNSDGDQDIEIEPDGSYFMKGVGIGTSSPPGSGLTIQSSGAQDALNIFETGGQNIFTIEESGDVGIGTTIPTDLLDIEKNQDAGTNFSVNNDSSGTSATTGMSVYGYGGGGGLYFYNQNHASLSHFADRLVLLTKFGTGGVDILAMETGADIRFYTNGYNASNEQARITSAGRLGIGVTNPGTMLAVSGLTGTASYNYVRVDTATGDFYYDSSSERYKENIQILETDFRKILEIDPKSFVDKTSRWDEIGLIAEDLDSAGLTDLVIYRDGLPDAVKYEKVSLYLLQIDKEQEKRLTALEELANFDEFGSFTELEGRVAGLEDSVEVLEEEIDSLEEKIYTLEEALELMKKPEEEETGEVENVEEVVE